MHLIYASGSIFVTPLSRFGTDTRHGSRHGGGMGRFEVTRTRARVGAGMLIAALLIAGRTLVGSGTATIDPAAAPAGEIEAAPVARLVVHVVGAVRRPGLYRLPHRAVVEAGAPAGAEPPEAAGGPVHLNSATLEQLDSLPGVGPVTAQKIVDYRTQHGAFSSIEDLDAIPGIGPARLEQLRDLVAP